MEFELSSFLFLFLSSSFFLIFILSRNGKPNPNLPPGPRKLPIIGNLHNLISSDPLHRTLKNLSEKHGPLMHLRLGEIDYLIASSPATAEKFMKRNDTVFANRPSLLATEIGCYGNTDIAFSPYGEYWKQLRRVSKLELLGPNPVRSARFIREEEISSLCKWLAQSAETAVSLTEKLSSTNFNIMVRAAFGGKNEEAGKLVELFKESPDFLAEFSVGDVFPSLKLLCLFSGVRRKVEKYHERADEISERIIARRREAIDAGVRKSGEGLLLDALLKLHGDQTLEIPLTIDNIKAVFVDLFGAGIEQSSTVVDWAMAEMLKNPNILKKAQDEVRKVFDARNNTVNEDYFDELHYLKLVIKETLRLHSPAPLLVPRESMGRCSINRYEIPSKTRVIVNAWAIGRDPGSWEEAESFKPERFYEKSVDFKASSFDFIPFGAGRRICPGMGFAMANIELQMAMFLYHFDWILPDGMKAEEVDMTEYFGVSTRRKYGLNVIPVVRRPLTLYTEKQGVNSYCSWAEILICKLS